MDYLQTDALSVGYNGKTLISKVALSVQRGRIVTLIGPNGSGKSTILKTIIGQLPSISGSVFLDGADMRSRSRGDVARRMAILMTARMDPELMTCRDVVSSGRYPYTGKLGGLCRPALPGRQRRAAAAHPARPRALPAAGAHRARRADELSRYPL